MTGLDLLFVVFEFFLRLLVMVEVKSNGQTMAVNVLAVIFMNVTEQANGVQAVVHLVLYFLHDIFGGGLIGVYC